MNKKTYLVQLKETDTSFSIDGFSLYTKGGFACIAYYTEDGKKRVKRFPLCAVHSIDSEY